MGQQANGLSHTKWLCKYHIVFTPKYRRKIIYNQYRQSIGEIFRRLCPYKGVEIIEGHLMPDHVHMLVNIPSKISVSSFMGYLKGKLSLRFLRSTATPNINSGTGSSGQKSTTYLPWGLMKLRLLNTSGSKKLMI